MSGAITITASVLLPVQDFRAFICQARFPKPTNRRPVQAVDICFPNSGVMVVRWEKEELWKRRIVRKQNLVLVGKRLRFRKTETIHKIWEVVESFEHEFNYCRIYGELPKSVTLCGYFLQTYFRKNTNDWCRLDITDSTVQFRGVLVRGAVVEQREPTRVVGLAGEYDEFRYLVSRAA
jgi:hypothetical protein